MIRNNKGQFVKGGLGETREEKIKRINSLRESARKSEKYLGELKFSPLYTVWRSFMFTKKGTKIGHDSKWSNFKSFYEDMKDSYKKGLRLGRLDKEKCFSKENCMWMTDSELAFSKKDAITFTYKGKTKLLKEWSLIYNIPYNALVQRFRKGKNYSEEELLFGKKTKKQKNIVDIRQLNLQNSKNKVSKMISAYKCKDKKRNRKFNLTKDWLLKNIIYKNCTYCNSKINIGCDRIDNSKGHTIDNVIPACYTCNVVRGNIFTVEEMKELGNTIKKILNNRIK